MPPGDFADASQQLAYRVTKILDHPPPGGWTLPQLQTELHPNPNDYWLLLCIVFDRNQPSTVERELCNFLLESIMANGNVQAAATQLGHFWSRALRQAAAGTPANIGHAFHATNERLNQFIPGARERGLPLVLNIAAGLMAPDLAPGASRCAQEYLYTVQVAGDPRAIQGWSRALVALLIFCAECVRHMNRCAGYFISLVNFLVIWSVQHRDQLGPELETHLSALSYTNEAHQAANDLVRDVLTRQQPPYTDTTVTQMWTTLLTTPEYRARIRTPAILLRTMELIAQPFLSRAPRPGMTAMDQAVSDGVVGYWDANVLLHADGQLLSVIVHTIVECPRKPIFTQETIRTALLERCGQKLAQALGISGFAIMLTPQFFKAIEAAGADADECIHMLQRVPAAAPFLFMGVLGYLTDNTTMPPATQHKLMFIGAVAMQQMALLPIAQHIHSGLVEEWQRCHQLSAQMASQPGLEAKIQSERRRIQLFGVMVGWAYANDYLSNPTFPQVIGTTPMIYIDYLLSQFFIHSDFVHNYSVFAGTELITRVAASRDINSIYGLTACVVQDLLRHPSLDYLVEIIAFVRAKITPTATDPTVTQTLADRVCAYAHAHASPALRANILKYIFAQEVPADVAAAVAAVHSAENRPRYALSPAPLPEGAACRALMMLITALKVVLLVLEHNEVSSILDTHVETLRQELYRLYRQDAKQAFEFLYTAPNMGAEGVGEHAVALVDEFARSIPRKTVQVAMNELQTRMAQVPMTQPREKLSRAVIAELINIERLRRSPSEGGYTREVFETVFSFNANNLFNNLVTAPHIFLSMLTCTDTRNLVPQVVRDRVSAQFPLLAPAIRRVTAPALAPETLVPQELGKTTAPELWAALAPVIRGSCGAPTDVSQYARIREQLNNLTQHNTAEVQGHIVDRIQRQPDLRANLIASLTYDCLSRCLKYEIPAPDSTKKSFIEFMMKFISDLGEALGEPLTASVLRATAKATSMLMGARNLAPASLVVLQNLAAVASYASAGNVCAWGIDPLELLADSVRRGTLELCVPYLLRLLSAQPASGIFSVQSGWGVCIITMLSAVFEHRVGENITRAFDDGAIRLAHAVYNNGTPQYALGALTNIFTSAHATPGSTWRALVDALVPAALRPAAHSAKNVHEAEFAQLVGESVGMLPAVVAGGCNCKLDDVQKLRRSLQARDGSDLARINDVLSISSVCDRSEAYFVNPQSLYGYPNTIRFPETTEGVGEGAATSATDARRSLELGRPNASATCLYRVSSITPSNDLIVIPEQILDPQTKDGLQLIRATPAGPRATDAAFEVFRQGTWTTLFGRLLAATTAKSFTASTSGTIQIAVASALRTAVAVGRIDTYYMTSAVRVAEYVALVGRRAALARAAPRISRTLETTLQAAAAAAVTHMRTPDGNSLSAEAIVQLQPFIQRACEFVAAQRSDALLHELDDVFVSSLNTHPVLSDMTFQRTPSGICTTLAITQSDYVKRERMNDSLAAIDRRFLLHIMQTQEVRRVSPRLRPSLSHLDVWGTHASRLTELSAALKHIEPPTIPCTNVARMDMASRIVSLQNVLPAAAPVITTVVSQAARTRNIIDIPGQRIVDTAARAAAAAVAGTSHQGQGHGPSVASIVAAADTHTPGAALTFACAGLYTMPPAASAVMSTATPATTPATSTATLLSDVTRAHANPTAALSGNPYEIAEAVRAGAPVADADAALAALVRTAGEGLRAWYRRCESSITKTNLIADKGVAVTALAPPKVVRPDTFPSLFGGGTPDQRCSTLRTAPPDTIRACYSANATGQWGRSGSPSPQHARTINHVAHVVRLLTVDTAYCTPAQLTKTMDALTNLAVNGCGQTTPTVGKAPIAFAPAAAANTLAQLAVLPVLPTGMPTLPSGPHAVAYHGTAMAIYSGLDVNMIPRATASLLAQYVRATRLGLAHDRSIGRHYARAMRACGISSVPVHALHAWTGVLEAAFRIDDAATAARLFIACLINYPVTADNAGGCIAGISFYFMEALRRFILNKSTMESTVLVPKFAFLLLTHVIDELYTHRAKLTAPHQLFPGADPSQPAGCGPVIHTITLSVLRLVDFCASMHNLGVHSVASIIGRPSLIHLCADGPTPLWECYGQLIGRLYGDYWRTLAESMHYAHHDMMYPADDIANGLVRMLALLAHDHGTLLHAIAPSILSNGQNIIRDHSDVRAATIMALLASAAPPGQVRTLPTTSSTRHIAEYLRTLDTRCAYSVHTDRRMHDQDLQKVKGTLQELMRQIDLHINIHSQTEAPLHEVQREFCDVLKHMPNQIRELFSDRKTFFPLAHSLVADHLIAAETGTTDMHPGAPRIVPAILYALYEALHFIGGCSPDVLTAQIFSRIIGTSETAAAAFRLCVTMRDKLSNYMQTMMMVGNVEEPAHRWSHLLLTLSEPHPRIAQFDFLAESLQQLRDN